MTKVTALFASLLLTSTLACAQPVLTEESDAARDTAWSGTFGSYHLGNADLDSGGSWSVTSVRAKTGYDWIEAPTSRLSWDVSFEWKEFSFDDIISPWNKAYTTDLSFAWNKQLDGDWGLMVTPSIGLSMEDGAKVSDSITFGGIFAFTKSFSRNLQLGIGAGVFSGLEDTRAFPFLLVRWQINESWYIGNPFAPGPIGPAGLEVGFRFNDEWTFAAGGAYRSERFRLNDEGPFGDGFGETKGMPVFFRSSYTLSQDTQFHFYIGTILSGELNVDDNTGHTITSTDYDPAVLTAVAWQGRF
jgi:hypothetical protein